MTKTQKILTRAIAGVIGMGGGVAMMVLINGDVHWSIGFGLGYIAGGVMAGLQDL